MRPMTSVGAMRSWSLRIKSTPPLALSSNSHVVPVVPLPEVGQETAPPRTGTSSPVLSACAGSLPGCASWSPNCGCDATSALFGVVLVGSGATRCPGPPLLGDPPISAPNPGTFPEVGSVCAYYASRRPSAKMRGGLQARTAALSRCGIRP